MKLIALALLLFGSCLAHSQEAIDLIESTLKLGISEEKGNIICPSFNVTSIYKDH